MEGYRNAALIAQDDALAAGGGGVMGTEGVAGWRMVNKDDR